MFIQIGFTHALIDTDATAACHDEPSANDAAATAAGSATAASPAATGTTAAGYEYS